MWGTKSTNKDTKGGEIHPQTEQTDCKKEIKPKQDWGLRKVLVDQLEKRRPIALRTAKGRNSNWAKHFDQKRSIGKIKVKKSWQNSRNIVFYLKLS